jgi:hypothetical protein
LNHLGYDNLSKLVKGGMATVVPVKAADFKAALSEGPVCSPCVQAKHARPPFPVSDSETFDICELVHMDVCGPYQETSLGGAKYVATFLDDYYKFSVVRTIAFKSDVAAEVKNVIEMLERQTGRQVKTVRTDRGSEYLNKELTAYQQGHPPSVVCSIHTTAE